MEGKELRKEINRVLTQQLNKGIKRWQIAVTLFSKGFSERQVGMIMEVNQRTAHAMKIDFSNDKRRREIRNHMILNARDMSVLIKKCKTLVSASSEERGR